MYMGLLWRRAAGGGQGHGDHGLAHEGALHGLLLLRAVQLEVLGLEDAAVLVGHLDHGILQLALVEAVSALLLDELEGLGLLLVIELVAGGIGEAAQLIGRLFGQQIDVAELGVGQHVGIVAVQMLGGGGPNVEAVLAQVDGGLDGIRERQRAVLLHGIGHAGHGAGDAHGTAAGGAGAADHGEALLGLVVDHGPVVLLGERGRGLTEVDELHVAVLVAQGHEAAAADTGGLGLSDGDSEGNRRRRVNRVATLLQDLEAGLGRPGGTSRDHGVGAVGATAFPDHVAVFVAQLPAGLLIGEHTRFPLELGRSLALSHGDTGQQGGRRHGGAGCRSSLQERTAGDFLLAHRVSSFVFIIS